MPLLLGPCNTPAGRVDLRCAPEQPSCPWLFSMPQRAPASPALIRAHHRSRRHAQHGIEASGFVCADLYEATRQSRSAPSTPLHFTVSSCTDRCMHAGLWHAGCFPPALPSLLHPHHWHIWQRADISRMGCTPSGMLIFGLSGLNARPGSPVKVHALLPLTRGSRASSAAVAVVAACDLPACELIECLDREHGGLAATVPRPRSHAHCELLVEIAVIPAPQATLTGAKLAAHACCRDHTYAGISNPHCAVNGTCRQSCVQCMVVRMHLQLCLTRYD